MHRRLYACANTKSCPILARDADLHLPVKHALEVWFKGWFGVRFKDCLEYRFKNWLENRIAHAHSIAYLTLNLSGHWAANKRHRYNLRHDCHQHPTLACLPAKHSPRLATGARHIQHRSRRLAARCPPPARAASRAANGCCRSHHARRARARGDYGHGQKRACGAQNCRNASFYWHARHVCAPCRGGAW